MNRKARIRLKWSGAVATAVTMAGLMFATPASAVGAGYPPPTLPASCSTVSAGTLTLSESSAVTTTVTSVESFAPPGTPVTVVFNGVTVETLAAPASGLITVVFAAEVGTTGPEVSINGTAFVRAYYGTNVLTESGTDSTTNTAVSCPVDLVLDPAGTVSSGGGGGSSSGNPGGGSSSGNPGGGSSTPQSPSGSGPLAFTGADLGALLIAAAALLIMGTIAVVVARRKGARTHRLRL